MAFSSQRNVLCYVNHEAYITSAVGAMPYPWSIEKVNSGSDSRGEKTGFRVPEVNNANVSKGIETGKQN